MSNNKKREIKRKMNTDKKKKMYQIKIKIQL